MKYVDEFRNAVIAKRLIKKIKDIARHIDRQVCLMEVCGTHTVAIFRSGIREILPQNIRIISGPGCPVCVTAQEDIDKAVAVCQLPQTIVTTFGDMMKVPGTLHSLTTIAARGYDVRLVYSALNALDIAQHNPAKRVVHLSVGFETTAPTIAATLMRARKEKINNFFILCAHKLIPPALRALLSSPKIKISGFILPGHVSTIIGARPYRFISEQHKICAVIAGFEPLDILQSVAVLLEQIRQGSSKIVIQYSRCVKDKGNAKAQQVLKRVFSICDTNWRGLGTIKKSGYRLRPSFKNFDIEQHIKFELPRQKQTNCRCGDVLQGIILPFECKLFKKACTPEKPIGPCMVSSEGTCAAYYRYGGRCG
ncbi:MAG: hydrogenase formation protein HypD [Candidatus Omnitrophota bacterium]